MRRRASVELGAVLSAIASQPDFDDVDRGILDATERLLRSRGLRDWSVEDVADEADVGRTSVYRRFGDRDNLVHAVLARELRRTLRLIQREIEGHDTLEDRAVAAVRTALTALDGSVVSALLVSDPETFLPFLTTEAGPLLEVARVAITTELSNWTQRPSPELAEAAARFGLSFILTRSTILPLNEPDELDAAVRRMVRPFLASLATPAGRTSH
ncbi:MAG: helix-turn-helix domain-containing protein [Nitriliruptorales bacterium]|nr:helix-turn-helix domain-containing protein [Nitriliruptorales bacterium]